MEDATLCSPHLDFVLTRNEIEVERVKANFSYLINRYMQTRGMTVEQTARLWGISIRNFERILDGDANLTLEMIGYICDSIGAEFCVTVNIVGQ